MFAQFPRHLPPVCAALLFAGIACGFLFVGTGEFSPGEVWKGLRGGDGISAHVLWGIRLPRLLVGLLSGAALAASGVVMQAFFRNALASPGLLGVSAGASAGAIVFLGLPSGVHAVVEAGLRLFLPEYFAHTLFVVPVASIMGAFTATALVVGFARRAGGGDRLLLAGIAVNALLGGVASLALSKMTLSVERGSQVMFWLMGGLENRNWEDVCMAAPIALGLVLLWPLGRAMDLICLGEREALSLGVDVRQMRWRLVALSTVLTAMATAVAGPVGFVGLVVPHVLRLLLGAEHRRLVPYSIIGGAIFMVACDWVGLLAGGVRTGVVSALVGGPFFLWLLRDRARAPRARERRAPTQTQASCRRN
ncbi:MAG: iron ABC transporter permease [Puniceicoccales bacterium]|jgi:iron complex transport system permease protein|nr:iron ABC transporter permease [Puniceicoccales bacterium]